MNFLAKRKTFCGLPLRYAPFIIGILDIIFISFTTVMVTIFIFVLTILGVHEFYIIFWIITIIIPNIFLFFANILLFFGVYKRHLPLIWQWIIQETITTFLADLYLFTTLFILYFEDQVWVYLAIVLLTGVRCFHISIVYSYYALLKNPEIDDVAGTELWSWRQLNDKKNLKEELEEGTGELPVTAPDTTPCV